MVISVKALSGTSAADYYLERDAGCEASYYLDPTEAEGRWSGRGAAALGLVGPLDGAGEQAFRQLLTGQHPSTGEQLARPVMRAHPAGRLPALRLMQAIGKVAEGQGPGLYRAIEVEGLGPALTRLSAAVELHPGSQTLDPRLAERLAAAAGLDVVEVFRDEDGTDRFTSALARAGERYDDRNTGYDVCVSAPKSVSTVFGLGSPEVAATVRLAHERAVRTALSYLDRECSHGLRGHQGDGQRASRIGTDGFVAAAFAHRTSRSNDPQLHTHVVVANLVHGADSKWSAIDSRALIRHAKTASYLYHATLRGELTRELGVSWTPVVKGIAEIEGIPADLQRAFSTRRVAIETELAVMGRDDRAAAQRACLATRPAKQHTDEGDLREQWRDTAIALGYDPADVLGRAIGGAVAPPEPDVPALTIELTGPAGLTQNTTTIDRRDVMQAVCQALPAGLPVTVDSVDRLADHVLASTHIVGLLLPGADQQPRYTTAELLANEQHALALADELRQSQTGTLGGHTPNRSLSREQYTLARDLAMNDEGLAVVVGPAGSGKTAALAAAHRSWKAGAVPVYGAAVAAIAARGLQSTTGIPSTTINRLLTDLDRIDPRTGQPAGLQRGSVLVIDEAGMVDTRTLTRLLKHAHASGSRLVLVGDAEQLPEIEAGGLFGSLARHPDTMRLTGNVRQIHDWERVALAELRNGQTGTAVLAYLNAKRIHVERSSDGVERAIAIRYIKALRDPVCRDVVALAATRAEVAAMNATIRAQMRRAQLLTGEPLVVDVRGEPREFAVGDVVVVTRNNRTLGVLNGTRGEVTSIDTADRSLVMTDREGQQHQLDEKWIAKGDLDHGYALTVHKAQGITVDLTLVNGIAALSKEAGYVALSRGRTANHIYTTADELGAASRQLGPGRERDSLSTAVEHLQLQLERRLAQQMASDQRPHLAALPHQRLQAPDLAQPKGLSR